MNAYEYIQTIGKKYWKEAAIVGTLVGMCALGTRQVQDTSFIYNGTPMHIEYVDTHFGPGEKNYVKNTYNIDATKSRAVVIESALEALTLIDYGANGTIDVARGWRNGKSAGDLRTVPGSGFYGLPDSTWMKK